LGQITGNPMYRERMAALDAADAEAAKHKQGMEKLTSEQQQALLMQNDAQAAAENMEILGQKGKKDSDDRQAAENKLARESDSAEKAADRGQALSVIERTHKNQLEQMEKAGTISDASAAKLAELRQKEATHAAGLAEAKAAKDAERQLTQTEAEGTQGVRVKQAERAAAGSPAETANGYADSAIADPSLSMGNSQNELAARIRTKHPEMSEDAAAELAASTLRRRTILHAGSAGGSINPAVRSHLTREMRRVGDDGKPVIGADGRPSKPMTKEEFRAYTETHASMPADQSDALFDRLNGIPSAGAAELPEPPAPGRAGPPRPSGTPRRSGGAWRQPTPEEVEKLRAERKAAADKARAGRPPARKHPYDRG
jgi:hypothetical protein